MNRRWLGLALAGLLLVVSPGSTRAEDEAASADASPLETRLYDVRALLWGATSHTADRGPYVAESWDINDSERPLFGAEGDERLRLLGSAPDLVEYVKTFVGPPGTWGREGVSIQSMAEAVLAVTAGVTEHDAIADLFARETRRTLATAVVDVALLVGDAEALRGAGGASAGRARLLACGRALVSPGGRSVARHGALHAVLNDVGVFVAKDARAPDPWIGVVPDGMACEAEVVSAAPGGVTVRVRGWWSAPPSLANYRTSEGDVLEIPASDGRSFEATLAVETGVWAFAPLSGGVVLGVRARVDEPAVAAADVAGEAIPRVDPSIPAGPLVRRSIDLARLLDLVPNAHGSRLSIRPSRFTPPGPPDLTDPHPVFLPEFLSKLIEYQVAPGIGSVEGASMSFGTGRLNVRHDATRLGAVEGLVTALGASFGRATDVRVSILALPLASLPEYWTGLDDALVADGGEALGRRAGARLVDALGLSLRDGQRLASLSGAMRTYVGDFDVEIAEKAAIANPVVWDVFNGTSLDVTCRPIAGRTEIALDLRLERGTVREMRNATSMHGAIQCPVYDVTRCLGSLTLPCGSTRIVGASSSGGDVTLVLLTATRP